MSSIISWILSLLGPILPGLGEKLLILGLEWLEVQVPGSKPFLDGIIAKLKAGTPPASLSVVQN